MSDLLERLVDRPRRIVLATFAAGRAAAQPSQVREVQPNREEPRRWAEFDRWTKAFERDRAR